jgi:alkylation response protein AidB-like acyl-CoA dehydrogenase
VQPASSKTLPRGGGFLLESTDRIFTPERFTEEHRAIARTTEEFWNRDVVPNLEAIQHQEPGVAVSVLRKSAELGLTAVLVPEQYGGMEMDLVSAMIVAEGIAKDGSYAAWHGAHAGIGTLPLLLFGTEEQKQRYLPKLTSGEWVGAYCLSEAHAGSDALAARTRADLSAEGTHYILNGQKMWITNGGAADFFTVFAKINGELFSTLLVERSWAGVSAGAEERKMGIKGSSTTPIFFDNVRVPVENVLGDIGRGHIIAFNILNLGRLKLGPFAVGGAKAVLAASLKYAKDRKAFHKSIAEFGLIQHKLAEMAVRIFAAETMSYRVTGVIQDRLFAGESMLKATEEFAAECSFVKVFASEMLDYVADEGVQIHGGYGYHQDYSVERAYRDSRINRIFEGTNEINRLLATGMLLKRAQRGQLPLVQAVKSLQEELLSGRPSTDIVANAKKVGLFVLGAAFQKFLTKLEEQQEVLAAITDVLMYAYAIESVHIRKPTAKMTTVFTEHAFTRIEEAARVILAASSQGDALRTNLAILRRLTKRDTPNTIEARRGIAGRLLEAERFVLV